MPLDLNDLGVGPPLGRVSERVHAFTVRQDRVGPMRNFPQRKMIPTPQIRRSEGHATATGINHNDVRAAIGRSAVTFRSGHGAVLP